MDDPAPVGRRRGVSPGAVAAAAWTVVVAGLVILGADLLWVVALGDEIRATGAVPDGIPFAAAPQDEWHNPIVLAEVFLSLVHAVGPVGLAGLQTLLVGLTLAVLVRDAHAGGARGMRVALVVSLVAVGAASELVVTRLPSLSLLPFVLLVAVLRSQERRPSRAVWLVPVLAVLWGNLHGAVLVGIAVLGVWVVASRGHRFLVRAGVGVASLSCLVLTSAGLGTPAYYVSALTNEAAARGSDLWAAPDPTQPLDLAMLLCALVLLGLAARSLRVWEWLVVLGLVVGTVDAGRHGVWLLLFLAPVAALSAGGRVSVADERSPAHGGSRRGVALVAVVASLLVGGVLGLRSEAVRPPGEDVVAAVREVAGGRPVLAVEPEAETLAQAGVRVWAANPVDAFTATTQVQFLDFLQECTVPDAGLEVALVQDDCAAPLLAEGWTEVARDGGRVLLRRSTD